MKLEAINRELKSYTCNRIEERERVMRYMGVGVDHKINDEVNDCLTKANNLLCITINGKAIPVSKEELEYIRERVSALVWGREHRDRLDR